MPDIKIMDASDDEPTPLPEPITITIDTEGQLVLMVGSLVQVVASSVETLSAVPEELSDTAHAVINSVGCLMDTLIDLLPEGAEREAFMAMSTGIAAAYDQLLMISMLRDFVSPFADVNGDAEGDQVSTQPFDVEAFLANVFGDDDEAMAFFAADEDGDEGTDALAS